MTLTTTKRAAIRLLLVLLSLSGVNSALSQTSAAFAFQHGEITAGDRVNGTLKFDHAVPCSANLSLYLREASTNQGFELTGMVSAGQDTATFSGSTPKDIAGDFYVGYVALPPCPGYSQYHPINFSQVTVKVKPGPADPNVYPSGAGFSLLLTQKQFLGTKAAELNALSGRIDSRVEENGMDSADLRTFLINVVEAAETALNIASGQYRAKLLKRTDDLPPFFEDFRRQYAHLHDELKAPAPGLKATDQDGVRLVYAQQPLKPRERPQAPSMGRNMSGTSPAIARAVKLTIDDNASAYRIVSSTGRATFRARFASLPKGATLYYRQAIEADFKRWSSSTDIPDAEFDLATFVFKFHKDECLDEPVRTIDPYSDTHPLVSVEFQRCTSK